ncbi:MAG: glycine--tRNA ligase subunit beta [Deltaproteobacteria bacterium]|nr:glycine--tRNA ligase subunit beta [Deltaproteobacteria bacterium]
MPKDLLVEIGTEEIPAAFIPKALESFSRLIKQASDESGLGFKGIKPFGTPRRLVVLVESLDEKQPDKETTLTGPAKKSAFDENGRPTKAAEGFAKSQGVKVSELKIAETPKGEYLCIRKEIKGKKTEIILLEILPNVIGSIPFPKAMRWGDWDVTFARPVHWLCAIFGKDIIPFKLGHIKSSNLSYGHRFLSPKPFRVDSIRTYLKKTKEASVIIDPCERKNIIAREIEKSLRGARGKGQGARVLKDDALLEEVAYLVEYPQALMGSFDKEFLSLPKEVVVNAMREHQRYFSVVDENDCLLPYFIFVANTKAKDPKVVMRGNERVLRARLNDARFYYAKDLKTPLAEYADKLKGVVFQEKLGTSYEKAERFKALANFISESIAPQSQQTVDRAAYLCKADLVSGMVGEFPKLQGIMGKEYALKSGELPDVADAILEHYMPVSAGGELPKGMAGALISIADKMDTICGCFSVGLIPTGNADPYGLRRQALGIIAIIIDKSFILPIDGLVDKSIELLNDKIKRPASDPRLQPSGTSIKNDVLEFFKERLRNQLLSQGYSFDTIDAVLSAPWYDINDAVQRIKALEGFKKNPACSLLTIAFKRVSNILKGQETRVKGQGIDASLFEYPNENELFEITQRIAPEIDEYWRKGDYEKVFETLASLKGTIDTFFDKVMVMVDDERICKNRLILLNMVRNLYYQIADLSRLQV